MNRARTVCVASLLLTCIFSLNLRAQWIECQVPQGLSATALYANKEQIFAGLSGGLFLSTDNGTNWLPSTDEFVAEGVQYVKTFGTSIFVSTTFGLYRSTNNGTSWGVIGNGLEDVSIKCLTSIGTTLFAGSNNGVYRSTNNGTDWILVNSGFNDFTVIEDITAIGSNLFAATGFYGVYLSTNNGTSWKAVNSGLQSVGTVSALAVINKNLFAGHSYGVAVSTNNGSSWKYINSGIEFASITSFEVVGDNLFAGSNKGIFITTNSGISWGDVALGLPSNSRVTHITSNKDYLYAGISTFTNPNKPIWRRRLSEMINTNSVQPLPSSNISSTAYPNPFTTSTTISYTLPKRDLVTIEVFDILGRKIQKLVNKVMDAGPHSVVFNGENLPLGVYTVKITSGASSEEMKVVLSK